MLKDLDDSFIIDLRYASTNNFTGKIIYPVPVCAIRKETGEKLVKAHNIFKKDGFRIKVWDAYRPLHVQRILFEACPYNDYVAKPPEKPITSGFRPRHNNGMAVDITLVDKDGNELEMPSDFDDFSERGKLSYKYMTKEARKNVDYLHKVMNSVGFRSYENEWWHFVDNIEEPTPYLDIPLEAFLR
ncbi:MAG: M15 family metallopeptidase [Tissierellia bacterium]|nr:M15 family metallopeptidase [Tissierellia bacterium]